MSALFSSSIGSWYNGIQWPVSNCPTVQLSNSPWWTATIKRCRLTSSPCCFACPPHCRDWRGGPGQQIGWTTGSCPGPPVAARRRTGRWLSGAQPADPEGEVAGQTTPFLSLLHLYVKDVAIKKTSRQDPEIIYSRSGSDKKAPLRIKVKGSGQCCGSRMFIPNLIFSHPGSRIQGQKNLWSRIRIKEFKYFNPKIVSKLSKIWSGMIIPDPDLDFIPIPDPGSRGSKRHRIPDLNTGSGSSLWTNKEEVPKLEG
jgi:hypothetical protein